MSDKAQEILKEAKDNFKYYFDVLAKYRKEARDDMDFVNGDPWTSEQKAMRGSRPMEIINDAKIDKRRTIEDYNKRSSTVKIRGLDNGVTKETAESYQGIINKINRDSHTDFVMDEAMDHMLSCGMGFFYLDTEYKDIYSHDQVVTVNKIDDPFSVALDIIDAKKIDYSDSEWGGWLEPYSVDQFEEMYPDGDRSSFPICDNYTAFNKNNCIVVCRYYRVEKKPDSLISVADPFNAGEVLNFHLSTVEEKNAELLQFYAQNNEDFEFDNLLGWLRDTGRLLKIRHFERNVINWYILNNDQILDEGEWAGSFIPIIPMLGSKYTVSNDVYFESLIREKKPSARMYNFVVSNVSEWLSVNPVAPFTAHYKKIKGFEQIWANANNNPISVLPYREVVDEATNQVDWAPPMKLPAAEIPQGWLAAGQMAQENKTRTSGLPDSALGLQGNEVSGTALDTRTENALDNRSIFFKKRKFSTILLGKAQCDLIQKIYDSERMEELVNTDGSSQLAMINKESHDKGEGQYKGKHLDIKGAKVGVYVDTGPSYGSQKKEAAVKAEALLHKTPEIFMPAVYPHIVRNMDMLGTDEMVEDINKLLPPELRPTDEEKTPQQLETELQQATQQIEQLSQVNKEMEQLLVSEKQKVQSQENIAQLKASTDLQKEELKQSAETQRERMSNLTDIKESEIQAQSRKEIELIKQSMNDLSGKLDMIVTAVTAKARP